MSWPTLSLRSKKRSHSCGKLWIGHLSLFILQLTFRLWGYNNLWAIDDNSIQFAVITHSTSNFLLFPLSLCFFWSNRRWHRPHAFDVLKSSTNTVSQTATFFRHWSSYIVPDFIIRLDGLNDVPIINAICHSFVQNCIHRLLCTYLLVKFHTSIFPLRNECRM